jgi:hypothetical protein
MRPICRVLPIAPSTYYAYAARRADPASCARHQPLVFLDHRSMVEIANSGCERLLRATIIQRKVTNDNRAM